MDMNFDNVTELYVQGREVSSLAIGGVQAWAAGSVVPRYTDIWWTDGTEPRFSRLMLEGDAGYGKLNLAGGSGTTKLQKVLFGSDVSAVNQMWVTGRAVWGQPTITVNELTSLGFADGVVSLGVSCVANASALQEVSLPSTLTAIGDYAFRYNYALSSVDIPSSVQSIGKFSFANVGCSSLVFHEGLQSIDIDAFYYSDPTRVVLPSSLTSVGGNAFQNNGLLTSLVVNGPTQFGSSTFSNCSVLVDVDLGTQLTSMGNSMFSYCSSLTGVAIPNSVTSIGNSTFSNCRSLTGMYVPNSVTSIGNSAF